MGTSDFINQIIFINLFIRCRQMKPRSVSTFWQVLIRDENMECIYWHMKTKHKTLGYPELLGSIVAKLHSLFNLFWCIATLCENSSSDRILLDSIPLNHPSCSRRLNFYYVSFDTFKFVDHGFSSWQVNFFSCNVSLLHEPLSFRKYEFITEYVLLQEYRFFLLRLSLISYQ